MPNFFPTSTPERRVLKVHELTEEIRELLENSLSDFWVTGEISDPRMPRSGHLYFSLKDHGAKIRGIIFKSHMRFLRFTPKEGELVLIRAHLSLYAPRGEYQLVCDYIEPVGTGMLQAEFEALKQKLENAGLFHEDRKRGIPNRPSNIGIITSPSGAAIQDILKVLKESRFPCRTLLFPVTVQGGNAAKEIVHALGHLNQYSQQAPGNTLDLLILTRGGGSLEDLSPFNDEEVALAISKSLIPVISAIGHETDTTISDYVADFRAPTPSIAAEIVVRNGIAVFEEVLDLQKVLLERMQMILTDRRTPLDFSLRLLVPPRRQVQFLLDQVNHLTVRLRQGMERIIEGRKNQIKTSALGISHLSPANRLIDLSKKCEDLHLRLIQETRHKIEQEKDRLQSVVGQLNLLSPLNILDRGYSITRSLPLLTVIREEAEVSLGDLLKIKLSQGSLVCKVEDKSTP